MIVRATPASASLPDSLEVLADAGVFLIRKIGDQLFGNDCCLDGIQVNYLTVKWFQFEFMEAREL